MLVLLEQSSSTFTNEPFARRSEQIGSQCYSGTTIGVQSWRPSPECANLPVRVSQAKSFTDLHVTRRANPIDDLYERQGPKFRESRLAIEQRIAELKIEATKEGPPVTEKSELDLLRFLDTHPAVRKPFLFLLENGNFRAVWKGTEGEQIGVQFRGDGEIQYVIFAKRPDSKKLMNAYGRDSFVGIDRQISAHDLERLLRA